MTMPNYQWFRPSMQPRQMRGVRQWLLEIRTHQRGTFNVAPRNAGSATTSISSTSQLLVDLQCSPALHGECKNEHPCGDFFWLKSFNAAPPYNGECNPSASAVPSCRVLFNAAPP